MASYNRRADRKGQIYAGSSNPGASTSYKDKQLATLYNPFSIKNNAPKWPDGLASHSIGRKQQFASEVYGQTVVIALFPGSTNWLVAYSAVGEIGGTPPQDYAPALVACHGDDRTFLYTDRVGTDPDSLARVWTIEPQLNKYSAWRPVSYALKIRCCNNDEKNDGWWEAIRTSRNKFLEGFGIAMRDTSVPTADPAAYKRPDTVTPVYEPQVFRGHALPTRDLAHDWLWDPKWFRQPTYCTGELKDIGDVTFQLNNEQQHNEFIKMRPINGTDDANAMYSESIQVYDWPEPPTKTTDPGGPVIPTAHKSLENILVYSKNTGAASADQHNEINLQESVIADSLDIVLIRLHGISNLSRILLHSVANIELMCGEFSELAQYQTVCYSDKDALERYIDYRQTLHKLPFHVDPAQYSS